MTLGLSAVNLAAVWLNLLRGTNATAPTGLYFKLHTGDPGSAGANSAAVGDSSRKAASYAAPATGSMSQTGTTPQWTNGGTAETLSHVSVWDASTGGNFLYSFQLTTPQAWASGNVYNLNTFSFALTPIAA